jgi:hypothetical protein
MFVNRIKICPDLRKFQLWFSRLRQCLFLKLLRQWTHKVGHFLSTISTIASDHPIAYDKYDRIRSVSDIQTLAFGSSARVCISDTDRLLMFYLVYIDNMCILILYKYTWSNCLSRSTVYLIMLRITGYTVKWNAFIIYTKLITFS